MSRSKKDTFWFAHDYEPTNDPKIQAMMADYGGLGYGIYWRIVEMLHSDSTHQLPFKRYIYAAIAKQLSANVSTCSTKMNKIKQPEISAEQVEIFIQDCIKDYELFSSDEAFFWSDRVLRNISDKKDISAKRSESGKKSAEARKKATNAEQVSTNAEQSATITGQDRTIQEESNDEAIKAILAQLADGGEAIDPALQQFYLMIVLKMVDVFLKKNPGYFFQKEADYSACLRIAYHIAQMKGWTKDSVLNTNLEACVDSWKKIVDFVAEDNWLGGRSLTDIASIKEWQRLVQKMSKPKKNETNLTNHSGAKSATALKSEQSATFLGLAQERIAALAAGAAGA